MRMVFSRKAFDSAAGGCPSPILPDRRLVSLPIALSPSPISFGDVDLGGLSVKHLFELAPNGGLGDDCHLDPDLRPESRPRRPGWRPVFGQCDSSLSHLENQGVSGWLAAAVTRELP